MNFRAAAGLASLALVIGLFAGAVAAGRLPDLASLPAKVGTMNGPEIALSDAGRRVASGLTCPCGCPDLLLACSCANPRGAAEVKTFIVQQLAAGRREADVRTDLINRYGAAIQKVSH